MLYKLIFLITILLIYAVIELYYYNNPDNSNNNGGGINANNEAPGGINANNEAGSGINANNEAPGGINSNNEAGGGINANNTTTDIEYIYTQRQRTAAKEREMHLSTNKEELSWQFKVKIKNKINKNMIPEDKQRLKEIQSVLKSLYIKYDHDQVIALKYDNINLNSN